MLYVAVFQTFVLPETETSISALLLMTSVVLAVLATPSSATSLTNALFVRKDLDMEVRTIHSLIVGR